MSKILKQNGNGKIIRAQTSGKVLKQNYNFGKGFYKGDNINAYIEVPSSVELDITQPFTILGFTDTSSASVNSVVLVKGGTDGLDKFTSTVYVNGAMYLGPINQYNFPNNTNGQSRNNLVGAISDGVYIRPTGNARLGLNVSSYLVSSITTDSSYKILCGRGGMVSYLSSYAKERLNYFIIYNRQISQIELDFLYNNKLGNELLNINNLQVLYKFEMFEILTFEGEDAVCVRDFSGLSNHGKVMNLPAGTLQEQLNYANTNLLKA